MDNNAANIVFEKGMPFFEMVSCFLISLCGDPIVFNDEGQIELKKDHYLQLDGRVVKPSHIFVNQLRENAQKGLLSKNNFIGGCCMMLANIAYESVKSQNDHSPEFEFFRHVRNASSHLNRFKFEKREPRRPATWRGVALDHTKPGDKNPLQGTYCFGQLLSVSDILWLLWDIEQRTKI